MSKAIVFTEEQKKVLAIEKGVHLVLAPPGSGKTELLAARVENAVSNGYKEDEIICLTFTNRAAKGMKERVESKFPDNKIIIGNIHHYCSEFLFKNQLLPQFTSILDEEDAEQILNEAKAELSYPENERDLYNNVKKPKVYNPSLQKLNTCIKQRELNFPEDLLVEPDYTTIPQIDLARRVCRKYESLKAEYDLMDFDDILTRTYYFLRNKKETYSICNFKWIQVDEVQDMNPLQWAILRLIANEKCLSVYFGDYEQAIFSFMGAQLRSLHKVEEECKNTPGNGIHNLQKNFRSPSYLLSIFVDYAQTLLKPIWKQRPIANITETAGEGYLRIYTVNGQVEAEATFITKEILPELRKDGSKTAIIVRVNDTADIISQKLTDNGIEHFKISGFDLFRRASIKGLMSFLSILDNEFDRMAWARILFLFGKMDSLKEARGLANNLFKCGLPPADILANQTSSLLTFSNNFKNGRMVIFDTETTGLDTATADIIQIAAIEMINGNPGRIFEVYIKTSKDLAGTEHIHNISRNFLNANGIEPGLGLQSFIDFLGNDPILVAHNLEYDYAVLQANLARYTGIRLEDLVKKEMDTLKLSKLIYQD